MPENEMSRFRSFAERYVIARAATFRVDHEEADSWECILRAKSVYKMISGVADEFRKKAANGNDDDGDVVGF